MPAAGHMVHMPAHIYIRVGRYADAAEANVRAIAADEDYLAQCQAQGLYPVSYYPHNLHFLWAAATFEGRRAVAVDAARQSRRKCRIITPARWRGRRTFRSRRWLAYARFGMWQEMLTEPKPPANGAVRDRHLALHARSGVRRARSSGRGGPSCVAEGRDGARGIHDDAEGSAAADEPADRVAHPGGELGLRGGNPDAAIAVLGEAVTIEDGIPYNEPPVWHQPPRQILGAVLLEAGRPEEAEAVYREDLKRFRENGWSLFGLAKSLEAQRRSSEALEVKRRFETAWKRADIRLTSSRIIEAGTGPGDGPVQPRLRRVLRRRKRRYTRPARDLADGTRLAYMEQGDANRVPVILLHGYTDSWRSYRASPPASATVASRACGDAARTWRLGQAGW